MLTRWSGSFCLRVTWRWPGGACEPGLCGTSGHTTSVPPRNAAWTAYIRRRFALDTLFANHNVLMTGGSHCLTSELETPESTGLRRGPPACPLQLTPRSCFTREVEAARFQPAKVSARESCERY